MSYLFTISDAAWPGSASAGGARAVRYSGSAEGATTVQDSLVGTLNLGGCFDFIAYIFRWHYRLLDYPMVKSPSFHHFGAFLYHLSRRVHPEFKVCRVLFCSESAWHAEHLFVILVD